MGLPDEESSMSGYLKKRSAAFSFPSALGPKICLGRLEATFGTANRPYAFRIPSAGQRLSRERV